MKRTSIFLWFYGLILASVILLFFANAGKKTDEKADEVAFEFLTKRANNYLSELQETGYQILDTLQLTSIKLHPMPPRWHYFKYDSSGIVQWSYNEWQPDTVCIQQHGFQYYEHATGWDLVINDTAKKLIVTHPLVRLDQGSFEEKNFIKPLENTDYEIIKKETPYALSNQAAYLSFYGNSSDSRIAGWLFVLSQIVLVIVFVFSYNFLKTGTIITFGISFLVRILAHKELLFTGLSTVEIFNPMIFANSQYLPSLGDLWLDLLVVAFFIFAIQGFLPKNKIANPFKANIYVFIITLLALFLADMIRSLVVSLVLNSNISFDVTDLASLSVYTGWSVLAVFTMFWLFYILVSNLFRAISYQKLSSFLFILILATVVFVVFQKIDAKRSFTGLLPSIIFATLTFALLMWKFNAGRVYRYLIYLTLFSIFFSTTVYENQVKREKEYLDHYASKLISSKDLEAEYLFKRMENLLAEEFIQPPDQRTIFSKKDDFENRLRRLYFSGYLDKYNLLVMRFDSSGTNINSSTRYTDADLNYLYNYQAFPTLSHHFYQVKSTEIFNGYLAKFEDCDINGHYGNIYILLEPKFIQSSYEYPQLVQRKREGRIIDLEHYSYGIYNHKKLMHQKGTFSYDLVFDSTQNFGQKKVDQTSKYYHFISRQDDKSLVVLSHPDNRQTAAISTFSFSFVLFTLLMMITGLFWWGFHFLREKYLKFWGDQDVYQSFRYKRITGLSDFGIDQVLLSTRIRFSMVSLVLVGLLISVYVTIQFIRINDKQRSENELMYKIREVANQIQNEVDLAGKLQKPEARQLIVNEVSDVFKVEASLFDAKGYLLASSVEDLYNKGILAPLMEPRALEKISLLRSSQILQTERIRNVEFTAAYIPLLDEKRTVIAYLNLPYFTQQHELDREISSYMVTFVNLYLFLMLLAFILAFVVSQRISKPLQIIRESMSNTGFGNSNELIDWKQNDEIGRLVQQYNKMVVQLGESAEKLSASEREGAWKEMARQVAHEIKNPLTPMKLNLQHLQRAWSDKSEKLEDTFKRVTNVLIEQIDGLSHLAGEFSNFANLPVDTVEDCNLTEILLNTIVLFEKTDNVFFQYNPNMEEVHIQADKNQLNRIFSNVIKNAIQAIPEKKRGKIVIELSNQNHEVEVTITDNGKGISSEDAHKIFVPNFSTKTSGMGLGLAMTRKMMEASNGTIRFESKVGIGTTFYLNWNRKSE